MKRGLIWFTEDLRVDDNETLCKAILENDEVVPVYFMDHLLEKPWLGIERVGPQRKEFLLQALQSLKKELVARGGDLLVVEGSSLTHLPLLCKQFGIRKVYTKKQVGSEEKFRQNVLRKEVLALGVDFETYSTSTLYHPDDLPFSVRDIPLLFTKFRKLAEKECKVREPFNAPERLAVPIFDSNIPTFSASRTPEWMEGGELEAMKRLKHFVWESKAILSYKETRDQLDGLDYSSKFSAWLSHGCISPRRIYQEIKKFEREFKANESTYWLVFELLWRDFFRFSFKKYPTAYFQRKGLHDQAPFEHFDSEKFEHWKLGKTKEPLINAGMNELRETGFVSNRMRQILASYWVYGLEQDWRFGAAWFEYCLVDYDVASNWGNWAYIAGVGNDNRGGRIFNIQKQEEYFDKTEAYRKRWANHSG